LKYSSLERLNVRTPSFPLLWPSGCWPTAEAFAGSPVLCWVLSQFDCVSRTLQDDWRRSKPRSFPSSFASKREIRRPHRSATWSVDAVATLVVPGRLGQRGLATTECEQMNGTKTILFGSGSRPADLLLGRLGALSKNQSSEFVFESDIYS
jgi:hypothetical protein